MARLQVLFRCIGEAVCAQGLRGLAGLVPFGEVVYDVARDALERFRRSQDQEQLRAALQEAVRAGVQEVKDEARAVAHEVAAGQPPEIELRLADYLTQVPALIRQSFKRPADALGLSLPPLLSLERAEDLLPFLPARLPRFKPGDCPPGVGDEGAKALAASPHVVNLSKLVLWDNHVGDEGVTALARSPNLAGLSTLDLGRNRVGDAGAIALASAPHMASLSALILVSNQIGDAGAAAIAASPHLANLAELKPLNNRISAAGVTALREKFGKRVRIY